MMKHNSFESPLKVTIIGELLEVQNFNITTNKIFIKMWHAHSMRNSPQERGTTRGPSAGLNACRLLPI